jgi:hypothetical protein
MPMKTWMYARRLFVLLILLLVVKQGDRTFSSAFEPSVRSLVISLYFLSYWLIFWGICTRVFNAFMKKVSDKRTWYRRLSAVSLILLLMVTLCSIVFDWGYYMIDRYWFGLTWQSVDFINPEIFDPSSFFEPLKVNPELLFGFILLFILVYGAHIFATSFKNVKELELIAEQQKKESITAQYNALKNQIDPHFFFNSLSVLSSLIYESTELSSAYISHLSKHYRYIMEMNTDDLLLVEKELEYLESYLFLLNIRHPDCISLSIILDNTTRSRGKVLPHSLQMLVENAVKHNVFKQGSPLIIEITEDAEYLIVRNRVNRRRLLNESTGIGLQNIKSRYAFESKKEMVFGETDHFFIVKLPKLI